MIAEGKAEDKAMMLRFANHEPDKNLQSEILLRAKPSASEQSSEVMVAKPP
jgi:hypothetical protein